MQQNGFAPVLKQRGGLPGVELTFTKSLPGQDPLVTDIQILTNSKFSFDINKDGRIDGKDVIAIKATKPYLKNEYFPENFGFRKFRSWTEEDKNRLLDVVNSSCIEHYSNWDELLNDRYVKCNSIPKGRIGWEYWGLPGSQSTHKTKLPGCFTLGVLIPGILLLLFVKFTKKGRSLKKTLHFKITIGALTLYICFVYFFFAPFTNKATEAIYDNDLVTVKKYWMFINPEITSDIVILFFPPLSKSSDSTLATLNQAVKDPLEIAITSGSTEIVKFLIEEKKLELPKYPLYLASNSGSLSTVKYLVETLGIEVNVGSIEAAYGKGFLDVGQYLISQYPNDIFEINLSILAMSGDLELFKTVMNSKNYVFKDICFALKEATRTYNNDIAKYIIHSNPEIFNIDFNKESRERNIFSEIFYNAVIYDNLEILSILVKRQPLIAEHYPLYM